ncbi:MAG: hypothetical protein NT069_24780, partial [Planctomycetota bacterium]|nr:hypothetical protein [Planctomycetota bacterium]
LPAWKRWIGYSVAPRGRLLLDAGARRAISQRGKSLLPIGVTGVQGEFHKGELVALVDPEGIEFARGLTNYNSHDARRIAGRRTDEIEIALGHFKYEEIVHVDISVAIRKEISMSAVETKLTILARRYETGEPVKVTVSAGKVERVEPAWPRGSVDDWPWIAPGLFDLQVNGYGGTSFTGTDVTPERAAAAIRSYLAHGVAQICPTVVTNSFESLACGLAAVHQACLQDPVVAAMVPGCHLEGPYLSGEDGPRGAHPRQHIRPADWSEFLRLQEASGNRICLVTIAPEVEGAVEFIRKAVAANVTIAIGHTGADSSQIAAAVDAGARLSTPHPAPQAPELPLGSTG